MLHARLEIAQVLDMFQVQAVITEFHAGEDPTVWSSQPASLMLPDGWEQDDLLTTTLRLLALWSESTNGH